MPFHTKYTILQPPLGSGGFGTVFKCSLIANSEIVRAVKKIPVNNMRTDQLDVIINEFRMLQVLNHPNIIRTYECFRDDYWFYIVSDLIKGDELYQYLYKKGSFSEIEAANIIKQVLSATLYCHNKKLVHRDLKPENLMFDEGSKNIKVIDFGAGSFYNDYTKLTNTIGSPFYIAPEVLRGNYTEKCDIWSIGVILYMLLSGKPPFYGRNNEEIYTAVHLGKYSLTIPEMKNVSFQAKNLIQRMLLYNPDKRLSAKQALSHEWIRKNAKLSKKGIQKPTYRTLREQKRALINLKSFKCESSLQEAMLFYIITHLSSEAEVEELRGMFLEFDEDCDGLISKEDLINAYRNSGRDVKEAEEIAELIIEKADFGGTGSIDISEFITVCLDKRKFFCDSKLKNGFDLFCNISSSEGNNEERYISIEDLKKVFNQGQFQNTESDFWENMVQNFLGNKTECYSDEDDTEGDKKNELKITFEDFKKMMSNFQKNQVFSMTNNIGKTLNTQILALTQM